MPVTRKTTPTPKTSGHGSLAGELRPKCMHEIFNILTNQKLFLNTYPKSLYVLDRQSWHPNTCLMYEPMPHKHTIWPTYPSMLLGTSNRNQICC